jgi:hypothetical protein
MNVLIVIFIIVFIIILIRYNNKAIDINKSNRDKINENILRDKTILNDKVNKIKPYLKPNILINPNDYSYDLKTDVNLYNYDDIFDFIVNTQSFYIDNEQAYEQFIYELKTFMKIYEILLIDASKSNKYIIIMKDNKRNILNHFNSIKIKSKLNEQNINDATDDLSKIINKYYNHIVKQQQKYINETGYTYDTTIIDKINISPYNNYDKYNSTFEIF